MSGVVQQKIFPSECTDRELVKLLSKHFFDKILTLRSSINSKSDESQLTENKVECSVKFEQMDSFLPVSIKELQHLISSMNNKSSLLDSAPVSLIKECSDIIFSILQLIVNKSFKEAEVPCHLKQATITPICKCSDLDPENIKNYRSISNTTFLSKVLEKVAFSQISSYVHKNGLYNINQSGYKQNHSCETALLYIINNIQQSIHDDNLTAVLMLDLSAAFDTIDHNCLFYKLHNYFGITGNALKWLSSYLTNRSSEVVIDNVHSLKTSNNFGVPQGSILGPLLFILYINKLTDVGYEFGLKMHSYADDTTLYIGFNPTTEFHTSS